ncbi:hypothetical protein F4778DRAFT_85218 [Xylariomycetidae sp. FL2044]|nr:hypothetical protein F4778DRAFT_85218 [Xylariomycetidae sp. FL2044]
MSFCVAVQSAIFYLVSCAPCLQARHHQQSKIRAKKERDEKVRLQAEYPGSYQHPDPFNTNPYWSEEIMMGPHTKTKKYTGGTSKDTGQRGLNSADKEHASVAGSSVGIGSPNPGSSPTVVADDGKLSFSTTLSDDWNRKRYQREDEELWGHELYRTGHKLMDAIKHAGSSAGRLLEVSLGMEPKPITEEDRQKFYFAPRNPPVNDYHPPIVRQVPLHRDGHMWMLQPPPAAKVMEGKVPVSRSASFASHLSRRTTMSDGPGLGRLVHEKTVEAKLRSGEVPSEMGSTPSLSRPTPKRSRTTSTQRHSSQRVTRSRSVSLESSDMSEELKKRRRPRPRQSITPSNDSSSDEEYFLKSTDSFGRGRRAVAARPKLEPIMSSQNSEKGLTGNSPSRTPSAQRPSLPKVRSPLTEISNNVNRTEQEQSDKTSVKVTKDTSKSSPGSA